MPPPYSYDYPRPAVTVDLIAFAAARDGVKVLMIQRDRDPFAGQWAFPGGFLDIEEPLQDAAIRELREETGLILPGPPEILGVYGDPGRDPRGRTISVAYIALLSEALEVASNDDARDAVWLDLDLTWRELLSATSRWFAFDHDQIFVDAYRRFGQSLLDSRGLKLLPNEFDLAAVRQLQRAVLKTGRKVKPWIDKRLRRGEIAEIAPGSNRYIQTRRLLGGLAQVKN